MVTCWLPAPYHMAGGLQLGLLAWQGALGQGDAERDTCVRLCTTRSLRCAASAHRTPLHAPALQVRVGLSGAPVHPRTRLPNQLGLHSPACRYGLTWCACAAARRRSGAMQRQSRWVGACGADACMHVAGAAPAALDSRMGPLCTPLSLKKSSFLKKKTFFYYNQAAFANWCKRVLQTELLISPQKSTLTASGGMAAASAWSPPRVLVGRLEVSILGARWAGLKAAGEQRLGLPLPSACARPLTAMAPCHSNPSTRSPQAAVPRRQQCSFSSAGWRRAAPARQRPAAVGRRWQRRGGGGCSRSAGWRPTAAAARRRRGGSAAAWRQRGRWRRRCCGSGEAAASQEAPCICRRAGHGSGVTNRHPLDA